MHRGGGTPSQCVINGEFDVEAFQEKWLEAKSLDILQSIARRNMNIENLDQNPELKLALIEACYTGKNER